jgi:hypothetical protein
VVGRVGLGHHYQDGIDGEGGCLRGFDEGAHGRGRLIPGQHKHGNWGRQIGGGQRHSTGINPANNGTAAARFAAHPKK